MVVRALGRLEAPEAAPLLAEVAASDSVLAVHAAQSLVEIPGTEAGNGLLAVCGEAASLDAALYAALELVERGDPRASPCVVARIKEEIASKNRLGPRSEKILDRLPGVARRGTARSLRALAEEVPAPAIAQRLRSCGHEIELTIDLGSDVEPWLELLEEGTPDELELAIRRLGELGDPRAVQPLRHVFGQIDPAKAHLVPEALARIDSERAVPFLISLLCEDTYRLSSLTEARNEAARALVTLSDGDHVASALRRAYVEEEGRLFVPLMALAKLRGPAGIDEILELKTLLLRRRGRRQVLRHERINWAIRMLRTGHEIPLSKIEDVR
jgi:HEAT repeat protein